MAYAKPKTTAELNELATVSVDHNIPIRQYFRSADVLIKQARIYRSEGDLEQAYILYMKYINLGLTELPKHAGYKNAANKRQLKTIKNNCLEALDALEQMKVQLDTAYRSYHDARARSDMETKQLVEETEEKELAAKNDHRKRDEKTLAEDDDDKTQQENKEQDTESTKIYQEPESWSLQEALKGVAGISNQPSTTTVYRPLLATLTASSTTYPTYLQRNQSDGFVYSSSGSSNNTASAQQPAAATPRVPPKLFDYKRPSPPLSKPTGLSPSAPPLPPKVKLGDDMVADIDPQQQQQPKQSAPALPPKVALAAPPEETSTSLATTEGGLPLRMLDIPSGLKKRFLSIAESNTMKNVETCGILCGKLKNNRFTMTTLVIPKQQGTSDTCTTENEEEVFEFQDANNLLTFGWIHTHPSQSCFLSSLDLHTHCSYQLMLPEAVAIVCAPKHQPDFGVFRLTNPPGVEIISSCKKEGVFHPHPDMPIYTDTHDDVGHVRVKDYDFKVVDLRK